MCACNPSIRTPYCSQWCGREFYGKLSETNLPGQFDYTKPQGWSCPKCQAVMSPSYPTCFYCKPIDVTDGIKALAERMAPGVKEMSKKIENAMKDRAEYCRDDELPRYGFTE